MFGYNKKKIRKDKKWKVKRKLMFQIQIKLMKKIMYIPFYILKYRKPQVTSNQ